MTWTRTELDSLFKTLPAPVRYQVFEARPTPPFVLWRFTDSNDLYADNENYEKIRELELVIASDDPADELRAAAEKLLRDNGFTYSIGFTYLNSERLYQITLTTEVIFNG